MAVECTLYFARPHINGLSRIVMEIGPLKILFRFLFSAHFLVYSLLLNIEELLALYFPFSTLEQTVGSQGVGEANPLRIYLNQLNKLLVLVL